MTAAYSDLFDLGQLTLFCSAALVLALTPGPGLLYVAARSLSGGRMEGIASSLGTGLGGMVHVVAGGLGISALIMASAGLFSALKWIGVAYLVWLGIRTYQTASLNLFDQTTVLGHPVPPSNRARAFREGIVVEALNPKTAAFFLALIPQFIDPSRGHTVWQFIILGFISVLLNTLADVAVAMIAERISSAAASHPQRVNRLTKASGLILIGLGLGLALANHPPA